MSLDKIDNCSSQTGKQSSTDFSEQTI